MKGLQKKIQQVCSTAVLGELALIERVENRRLEAIKFLNDTDAYEMATTISANAADIMKFFDDLGTLFRNGTLATYTCMVGFPNVPSERVPGMARRIKMVRHLRFTERIDAAKEKRCQAYV